MTKRQELSETLNHLIELNKDSAKAFKRAAAGLSDVQEKQLEALMARRAEARASVVDELQRMVASLDTEPAEEGTQEGMLERGWMNIKAAMTIETDKTDAVVLADLIEQEEELLAAYEDALQEELPTDVGELLRRQATEIKQTLHQLEQLKEEIEDN